MCQVINFKERYLENQAGPNKVALFGGPWIYAVPLRAIAHLSALTVRQKDNSSNGQFVKGTVRQKDNSSNGHFVKGTVRQKDNSSNGHFVKGTVRQKDISSNGHFVKRTFRQRDSSFEVKDQRMTALIVSILIGLSTFISPLLNLIPIAVIYGVFLYMGVTALEGLLLTNR